ncbi:MAG TPA: hypothetical protein H9827_01215 [Candidatus Luteimonas excrementigallinarum]|nr:hypothetical protein [Candidatus Luteimonas excrementigallinarum]
MIEAIQAAGIDATTGAAGGASAGAAAQPQASATEVGNFAQAQQRVSGASEAQQTPGTDAVSGATQAEPSQGTRMIMSAFDGLNGGAKKIAELSESMASASKVGDLTPSQMLEMTMSTHQFLFQSQLTANVANRTSDGVQQLFRQQS